jgi:hypothetical protein
MQQPETITFFTTQLSIIIGFFWNLDFTGLRMVLAMATLTILLFHLTPRDQNVMLKSVALSIGRLTWSSIVLGTLDYLVKAASKHHTSGFYTEMSVQFFAASLGLLIGYTVCAMHKKQ